jgi:hypothetical protein
MPKNVVIIPASGLTYFNNTASQTIGQILVDPVTEEFLISGATLNLDAVTSVNVGSGYGDVYIGDGITPTNIIFEENGSIKGDGSAIELTLGSSTDYVKISSNGQFDLIGVASASTPSNILSYNPATSRVTYSPYSSSSGSSNTISGTKGTVTTSGSTSTAFLTFSGSNTIGGTGYTDFIRVTNTAAGATNPTKTIRINNTGGLEIVNSAYNSTPLSLSDSGNLSVAGTVTANSWSAGQVIKDTILSNTEVTISTTTIATSNADTDFLTYSYTPTSSNSYLIIHYHLASYDFTSGTGNDSYFSRIKVDGNEITFGAQNTVNGFRTGVLFPLTGRYTNSNTTAKSIVVACRRNSADDSISIVNSSTSMWLRITEIGR